MFRKIVIFFAFLGFAPLVHALTSDFENEKLSLYLGTRQNADDTDFLACFELKNGWHISYQNPGDAGVPTEFDFDFVKAKLLNTSAPKRFLYQDIITQYGYDELGCYLFKLSNVSKQSSVNISWTACQDECVPESFEAKIAQISNFDMALYQKALKSFPAVFEKQVAGLQKGDDLILSTKAALEDDTYFIGTENVINADAEQIFEKKGEKSILTIKTDGMESLPTQGLFITQNKAYVFDIVYQKPNLYWLLTLAFLAGIILNLMPCVFPVLSLKAMQTARDAYQKKGRIKRAFAYSFGVVASFLSIAGILYVLKSTGAALGWGFQLQSPIFVVVMIVLFVLILLQCLEIFHLRLPFVDEMHRASSVNSFLTGFFAVLIASPCTGPFMGAAVGYALFESAEVYFPIFLFLSLGYALPFAMLEIFPRIVRKVLPRPGKWMNTVKYVLSLPIALTIVWLSWVLYHEVVPHHDDYLWQKYSPEVLDDALNNDEAVLIDFTAKWCLTCLLNEHTVLNSDEFSKFARTRKIRLLKADWTSKDAAIFEALKKYGRSSIPLYVFYQKGHTDYIILPSILRTDNLLAVLDGQNQNDD